jgi:hypothetical protein
MGPTFANNAVQLRPTQGFGVYVSEKWTPLPTLDVVLAVRGDYDTVFLKGERKIYLNPRAALVYRPLDALSFKLMYNTSTRMPNAFYGPRNLSWGSNRSTGTHDQWYDTNPTANRASVLKTLELQSILYAGPARLSANVYRQNLTDFIAWNFPFTNVGDFHSWGLESNLQLRMTDKLEANVAFMWLIENQFVTTSKLLNPEEFIQRQPGDASGKNIYANSQGENIGSAKFQIYAGGSYDLLDWVSISAALRLQARNPYRRNKLDAVGMTVAEEDHTSSMFVDLGISKDDIFASGWFFGVFARNLLNEHHFVGTVEGVLVQEPEGFSAMAKIAKNF